MAVQQGKINCRKGFRRSLAAEARVVHSLEGETHRFLRCDV
jgi:hypothetical protein